MSDYSLLNGERMDEVNDAIRLIQYKEGLTFGTDALLLAAFLKGTEKDIGIEFGTGTGIISLLAAARGKAGRIYALEAQERYADLARRNAALNSMQERITVLHADVRDIARCPAEDADLIFTNPPYMTTSSGFANRISEKNLARHEVLGGIADFCAAAKRKLRFGGRFYCVYRPDRLVDLICAMRDAGIEPKRMIPVSASFAASPSMILAEGRRGGAPGMHFLPALYLYKDGTHRAYSDEMQYILEHGNFPERMQH